MDIWSLTFVKNSMSYSKFASAQTGGWMGSAKCGQVWTGKEEGEKSLKMRGLYGWSLIYLNSS